MRHGKTLRLRFEELGFWDADSDEATHDALDAVASLRDEIVSLRAERKYEREVLTSSPPQNALARDLAHIAGSALEVK